MPAIVLPKLTAPEQAVMRWLCGGWKGYEVCGAIEINGQKRGTGQTMRALERKGLVKKGEGISWLATTEGRALKFPDKPRSPGYLAA